MLDAAAHVVDVAYALDSPMTLRASGHRRRSGWQLGRRRRVATQAGHVLALARQTARVRGR